MGPVGFFGIIASLAALPFASARFSKNRTVLAFGLFLVHASAAVFYYLYVQSNPADTNLYFYDRARIRHEPFRLGTTLTVQLVQYMKVKFGGSYLDYFLLFQSIGFWGVIILMRTIHEIHLKLSMKPTAFSYMILFLPGVHFWTSAIGKDAPLFFAVSLVLWSSINLWKRMPFFAFAVLAMVLFRPHIALITLGAVSIAEFFNPKSRPLVKAGLLGAAITGLGFVAGTVRSTLAVDVTASSSMGEFIERYNATAQDIDGTTNVFGASYPSRLFGLLFRPLFFDAEGALGLVASLENAVYLFMVSFIILRLPTTLRLAKRIFFVKFALVYALVLSLLLAVIWYNVGLGLRQKMMIMPAVFSVFVIHWALYTARARSRSALQAVPQSRPTSSSGGASGLTSIQPLT